MRRRSIILPAVMAGSCAALGAVYAMMIAPRWLNVAHIALHLPLLPDAWHGVRVVHISDIHFGGRNTSQRMLLAARERALAFKPDIVAITGDFFHDGIVEDTADAFTRWPSHVQVFAVLGNHDHRGGEENLRKLHEMLARGGVRLLVNEAAAFPLRGIDAWIVGVDDPYTWRADAEYAFDDLPDGADALLFLAHAPSVVRSMPVGRARLVLSGHTHGGQLRLIPSGRIPMMEHLRKALGEPVRNDPPVHHGIHWIRGSVVSVSNGLGLSQFPARFRTRPQLTVFELRPLHSSDVPCDDVRRYAHILTSEGRVARWLT